MRSLAWNRLSIGVLAVAAAAWSGACASSGYTPRPFPTPGGVTPSSHPAPVHPAPSDPASAPADPSDAPSHPAPSHPAPSHPAPSHPAPLDSGSPAPRTASPGTSLDPYALVGTALALRGAPYRNGGTDPQGFDCSGFTQYVFSQFGLSLPREVREQYRVGKSVKEDDLAPGDILFFTTTDPGPSHVGIAIGGDQFVHAPSSNGVVRVERLTSSYWSPRYLGARRVTN